MNLMKKNAKFCLLAVVILIPSFIACNKSKSNTKVPITVNLSVQLTNTSDQNVLFWSSNDLAQISVVHNSMLSHHHNFTVTSNEDNTFNFYVKKEGSTNSYDAVRPYYISVSENNNPVDVEERFIWDGTKLTSN
jgi:hypothetical protein